MSTELAYLDGLATDLVNHLDAAREAELDANGRSILWQGLVSTLHNARSLNSQIELLQDIAQQVVPPVVVEPEPAEPPADGFMANAGVEWYKWPEHVPRNEREVFPEADAWPDYELHQVIDLEGRTIIFEQSRIRDELGAQLRSDSAVKFCNGTIIGGRVGWTHNAQIVLENVRLVGSIGAKNRAGGQERLWCDNVQAVSGVDDYSVAQPTAGNDFGGRQYWRNSTSSGYRSGWRSVWSLDNCLVLDCGEDGKSNYQYARHVEVRNPAKLGSPIKLPDGTVIQGPHPDVSQQVWHHVGAFVLGFRAVGNIFAMGFNAGRSSQKFTMIDVTVEVAGGERNAIVGGTHKDIYIRNYQAIGGMQLIEPDTNWTGTVIDTPWIKEYADQPGLAGVTFLP